MFSPSSRLLQLVKQILLGKKLEYSNSATANVGMLRRVVQLLGTKASGDWTLTHTVTVTVGT